MKNHIAAEKMVTKGFSLPSMDGRITSLSDFEGKVAFVNLWATWCGPCVAEMPLLQVASEVYADDIVIVGITDESVDTYRLLAEKLEITYPLLSSSESPFMDNMRKHVMGIPTTFVLGKDHKVRTVLSGCLDAEKLNAALRTLGVEVKELEVPE